ncbi:MULTISPECIES: hypothetical protein [Neobacillus]|uniref:Uncharacterized protein n=1 Tax=Neobacillus rhizophilus TaxID=2833579 RepID=A0A942YRZ9_9BACI|nr:MULTISPECIES: hypothetical protein [Neobacillus]MBS4211363.1 hypothetical protein [Neobacillus rhizophilus]
MGLYINKREHPNVFENKQTLNAPNQSYSRQDFLTELIKEQEIANAALRKTLRELQIRTLKQEESQTSHWNDIGSQLNDLQKSSQSHQEMMRMQEKFQEEIADKLNRQTVFQKEVTEKLNSQEEFQNQISAKMNKQEEFQEDVLKRLDYQEALTEKISRQLNFIRSILFERTNYLASKIEDGYKLTSSYVYKLMTGSDKPLTFFLMNQNNDERPKLTDKP